MPTQFKFEMPKNVVVDGKTKTATYAKMTAEPFEGGFGHTLGNALRRVLLSSLEGAAITSVKIDGVAHEFSSIEGVYQDVTHIVLNFKRVLFSVTTRKSFECTIKAKGPCDVTAGMIAVPAGVEILNPDHVVFTITEKKTVKMEIAVAIGRGYRPAEMNKEASQTIGVIPIDSLFSPVSKVKYAVEAARVGMKTDYDRLILEVWTDGRVDPVAATVQSAQLMLDHVQLFRNAGDPSYLEGMPDEVVVEGVEPDATDRGIHEGDGIEEQGLTKRTTNALVKAGVTSIHQMLQKTERELFSLRNFGDKAVEEVKDFLKEKNLELKREPATEAEIAEIMKKGTKKKKVAV